MTNPHEALARMQKATKLADYLSANLSRMVTVYLEAKNLTAEPDLAELTNMTPEKIYCTAASLDVRHWVILAQRAGVKFPSIETRRLILETLRMRAGGVR